MSGRAVRQRRRSSESVVMVACVGAKQRTTTKENEEVIWRCVIVSWGVPFSWESPRRGHVRELGHCMPSLVTDGATNLFWKRFLKMAIVAMLYGYTHATFSFVLCIIAACSNVNCCST